MNHASPIRVDRARPGDLITGTLASGDYPEPCRIAAIVEAPEHSQRMTAYWLVWMDGGRVCYYGDTEIWLGQRP
jgi:hypothetical protein